MNKIELLSPAGDFDCLKAAVEAGADAVYLGIDKFNARLRADNFTTDNIEEAIDYAHIRGVKTYLALNTLIKKSEFNEALEIVNLVYQKGIDAVIVQDLGLASTIIKNFTDLPVHASTQMTIYDLEGVDLLKKVGFDRVVLARETSLEAIKEIADKTTIDIEVFVHGALCVSYSGQCLMSSFIGKRSGNRGECAQPCRLKYAVKDNEKRAYYLSLKDICTANDIKKIVNSGVKSLKIEGRMKGPEYVYSAVKSYKSAISGINEKNYSDYMARVYNRGNFTKGFILGDGKNISFRSKPNNCGIHTGEIEDCENKKGFICVNLTGSISTGDVLECFSKKENRYKSFTITKILKDKRKVGLAFKGESVMINSNFNFDKGSKVYKVYDKNLMKDISVKLKQDNKKIKVNAAFELKKDKKPLIAVWYNDEKIVVEGNVKPEIAINKSLTKERLKENLNKTKSTTFEFKDIKIDLDDNLMLKASETNRMRRDILEILKNKVIKNYKKNCANIIRTENLMDNNSDKSINLSVYFNSWENKYDLAKIRAKRFYMPIDFFIKSKKNYFMDIKNKGIQLFIWIPPITKRNYWKGFKSNIEPLLDDNVIDGVLISNYSHLKKVRAKSIYGNYNLNVVNESTTLKLKELGLKGITYSVELNGEEISDLKSNIDSEIIVYGRLPLMYSEHCIKRSQNIDCSESGIELKDRLNYKFPVFCDKLNCVSVIFNSKILYLKNNFDIIKKINPNWMRLYITDEEMRQIINITDEYNEILGYNSKENSIKNEVNDNYNYTKGHYFRGV